MAKQCGSFQLVDYKETSSLKDCLKLHPTESMSLHWSNWDDLAHQMSRDAGEDPLNRFDTLGTELEQYKEWPIWIQTRNEVRESSLYDLYRAYLDPRLRDLWFFNEDCDHQVSIQDRQGPFVRLNSLRWIDPNITKEMAFYKILEGFSFLRKFRLNWNTTGNVKVGKYFENEYPIQLEQLTYHGLLFKIKGGEVFNRMLLHESVKMTLPLGEIFKLSQLSGRNFLEDYMEGTLSHEESYHEYMVYLHNAFNGEQMSIYKFSHQKHYYFFIPFESFIGIDNQMCLKTVVCGFLDHMRDCLDEELQAA